MFGNNKKIQELEERIQDLHQQLIAKDDIQRASKLEIGGLNHRIETLKAELKEAQDKIIYREVEIAFEEIAQTFEKTLYDFPTVREYNKRLKANRLEQATRINKLVRYSTTWKYAGSAVDGQKMVLNYVKQITRTFNIECEVLISKVNANNALAIEQEIRNAFDELNQLNSFLRISLKEEFLTLKLQEMYIIHSWELKKQEIKEEKARERAILAEQKQAEKELEASRKAMEKEVKHYEKAIEKAKTVEQSMELTHKLEAIKENLATVDYRQANQRAGYVYVISNIGAFGENVYKIGMTRRLDPQDRVDELGGASVPFKFDTHAMIFSDDAPSLETKLHQHFASQKVNLVNGRKEFFNVELSEVEDFISSMDIEASFEYVAQAPQYRETLNLRK